MQKTSELGYNGFYYKIKEAECTDRKFVLTGTTRRKLIKVTEQLMIIKFTYKKSSALAY